MDFVNQLSHLTGADVAASTNDTGASGDWVLEYRSGEVAQPSLSADSYQFDLATIKVTNLNDSGAGSLRAAVLAATGNGAADTIVFDPALFASGMATITLTSGALNVHGTSDADAFSIVGPGEGLLTISGNNASRIFVADSYVSYGVYAANTSGLSISGMTLTNANNTGNTRDGFGGGAVFSYYSGALTLDHVRVTGSTSVGSGGGVGFLSPSSNLTITNSTFSGNTVTGSSGYGGGLAGFAGTGTLTIDSSTLSGNTSFRGGGGAQIGVNGGAFTITNTTIADNTSNLTGSNTLGGGGLLIQNGTGTPGSIINSTIVGNHANATVLAAAFDGGGIATNNVDITLKNTLVANNTSATNVAANQNLVLGQNTNAVGSNNLITSIGTYSSATNSLTGTIATLGSALGTLGYNGGAVQTIAITTGSNAISAGTSSGAPTLDARGFGRGGTTDIGAFEFSENDTFSFTGVVSPAKGVIDVPVGYDLPDRIRQGRVGGRSQEHRHLPPVRQCGAGNHCRQRQQQGDFQQRHGWCEQQGHHQSDRQPQWADCQHDVLIDSGAFQDGAGNTFNGIADTTAWTFTSAASPGPVVTSATYDATTGVLAVTAANIVGGDTIDVSKLTVTGQGGSPTRSPRPTSPRRVPRRSPRP